MFFLADGSEVEGKTGELSLRNGLTIVVMICAWSSVTIVGEAQRLKPETPNLLRKVGDHL